MGYNYKQWVYLNKQMKCISPYDGKKMLELGNQWLKKPVMKKLGTTDKIAKSVFEGMGFKHVSFDLNGEDGSIPIDLSKVIEDKKHYSAYDIVTNSGTTEHVDPFTSQHECFMNIHLCAKPGALIVNMVPGDGYRIKSRGRHCQTYYTVKFFDDLAAANDYKILYLKENGTMVFASFIKEGDNEFCKDRDAFFKNLIYSPFPKGYCRYPNLK